MVFIKGCGVLWCVSGNIFEGGGILFIIFCDWRWGMGIMYDFGMIFSVEIVR
jgi:hypothetical protein